ncbi:conserved hypothetical protein [Aliarcobacter butzleri JV22]|nr:conserved hypothetical protein [Aliarcobacter butzleri JV22]
MKMLFYLLMGLLPFTLNADEKKYRFMYQLIFLKKERFMKQTLKLLGIFGVQQ